MITSWRPELLFVEGEFRGGLALDCDEAGNIVFVGPDESASTENIQRLPGRALLPGMIDVHSHSFQRALRGRAESRRRSGPDFWSWRNTMYRCALALTPEEIYDVARMAFLEMLLAGITSVGEFHYLHRTATGDPYADPNLLAKQVIRAANDVGIRIVLLNCAYARAGHNLPPDPGQVRFIETDPDQFLHTAEALMTCKDTAHPTVTFGIAPHSIRAVPKGYLDRIATWTQARNLPLHMHVAEQPAEIAACRAEYNRTPFELLDELNILDQNFTAVHAIHLEDTEVARVGRAAITIAACGTTERNLGDGILRANDLLAAGASIACGTDSHCQTDALENARELETNLRLRDLERAVLDDAHGHPLSNLLFEFLTLAGARSLHLNAGTLQAGKAADFIAIDLDDTALAGSLPQELLTNLVLSASPRCITDVIVAGKRVVDRRQHPDVQEILGAFRRVQQRLGAAL